MSHSDTSPSNPPSASYTLILWAIFSSTAVVGLGIGGMAPLLAVILETRGVDSILIGINSAMSPLGAVCTAAFVPKLIARYGTLNTLIASTLFAGVSVMPMAYFDDIWFWYGCRFVFGAALALPWVLVETWINDLSTAKNRGRLMALYVTFLSAGFAAGPLVVRFVGHEGVLPFAVCAGLIIASAIPFFMLRNNDVGVSFESHGENTGFIRLALTIPSILGAAAICGVLDAALITFTPIYGMRNGLSEETAFEVVALLVAGSLLLQLPIGWLADKVNRRAIMAGLVMISIVGPWLFQMTITDPYPRFAVLVVWGGAVFSIYTIGLAMLGDRFKGVALAVGNAAFVTAFEFSNIIGPPTAGLSMQFLGPDGLLYFISGVSAVYLVFLLIRGLRQTDVKSEL